LEAKPFAALVIHYSLQKYVYTPPPSTARRTSLVVPPTPDAPKDGQHGTKRVVSRRWSYHAGEKQEGRYQDQKQEEQEQKQEEQEQKQEEQEQNQANERTESADQGEILRDFQEPRVLIKNLDTGHYL
jgi:hypothetical protein